MHPFLAALLLAASVAGQEPESIGVLRIADAEGRSITLDAPGVLYLVDFWAVGCKPCIQEVPELERLAKEYEPGGRFRFVNVVASGWEGKDLLMVAQQAGMTLPVYADPDDLFRKLHITAFPTKLLIRDGKLLRRKRGGGPGAYETWKRVLDEELKDPPGDELAVTYGRVLLPLITALAMSAYASEVEEKERTLQRLARVAELYRDSALGFACQETIVYSGRESVRVQFAYLFIRDEHGRLRDFRTWRTGTTAKERGQEVDPSDYKVPRYLASAYLWAFVFRADRQPLYRFEQLRERTVGDRSAIVIQFLPREPIRAGLNDWAGFATVDRETSQILEVEAYSPADWNSRVHRDAEAARAPTRDVHEDRPFYDIERIITKFGFEKNGMRFPSHVEITKTRSTIFPGATDEVVRETTLRRVTQDYSRFEFFSVRSSDEILHFVNGEAALPAE